MCNLLFEIFTLCDLNTCRDFSMGVVDEHKPCLLIVYTDRHLVGIVDVIVLFVFLLVSMLLLLKYFLLAFLSLLLNHLHLNGLAIWFVAVLVARGEELGAQGSLPHTGGPQHQHSGHRNYRISISND